VSGGALAPGECNQRHRRLAPLRSHSMFRSVFFYNADPSCPLLLQRPAHLQSSPGPRPSSNLARLAQVEDVLGAVHVYKNQHEIDQASGSGREELGLISVRYARFPDLLDVS
jgi:hypothetical protein